MLVPASESLASGGGTHLEVLELYTAAGSYIVKGKSLGFSLLRPGLSLHSK